MDLSGVEVMDRFREFMDLRELDLWNMIQHFLTLACIDHYDELRLRRDRFVELMYTPRPWQGSDIDLVCNFSSNKTDGSSEMCNKAVEKEPQHMKNEEEKEEGECYSDDEEDDKEEGECREEQEIEGIRESEDDAPVANHVALDTFNDDGEEQEIVLIDESEDDEPVANNVALNTFDDDGEEQEIMQIVESEDDKPVTLDVALDTLDEDMGTTLPDMITGELLSPELLYVKEIYSLRTIMESIPVNHHLPDNEALKILDRLHGLNIDFLFVAALRENNIIGKVVSRMSRKHPDSAVKKKAHALVSAWKVRIDEYMAIQLAEEASIQDASGPVSEKEASLPAPSQLGERNIFTSQDLKISKRVVPHPTHTNTAIMNSKRKLQEGYVRHEKKKRTTQLLGLTGYLKVAQT